MIHFPSYDFSVKQGLTDIQKKNEKWMKELSAVKVGGRSVDGSISRSVQYANDFQS